MAHSCSIMKKFMLYYKPIIYQESHACICMVDAVERKRKMHKGLREMAETYLRQKTDQNINLLAALQDGIAEVAAADARGCLLCTAGNIWQLAAADAETALRFYEMVPTDTTMLEVQEASQIDLIAERFRPRCIETYYNAWYAEAAIELPDIGAQVRLMTEEDADELARYYYLPGPDAGNLTETANYLRQRAASHTLYGAYFDGALAGFVGTHDEGSIGVLTVVPAFRRRGLGTYLERLAIQKALERGHLPFGQIAKGNEASLALQRSMGMTISEEMVCWMDK